MKQASPFLLVILLLGSPADAQWELRGHGKYQFLLQHFEPEDVGALLVTERPVDHRLDVRTNVTYRRQRLDLTATGELLGFFGDTAAAERQSPEDVEAYLLGLPDLEDTHQWFDLGWGGTLGERGGLFGRFDRLSVGYTGDRLVARFGRQALSWGNGLVFQTMDLFDPFSPNVLDVDYKPGRDMLTMQWLLQAGDDVQTILVPGRQSRDDPLAAAQSSVAAKWHHFQQGTELDLLAAHHVGDTVLGGSASHSLAGGVWRVDLSYTNVAMHHVISALTNFDRAWTPGGRTLYGFAEYFYNGFGVTGTETGIISLDPALVARLERGELFNFGRHELATGVQFQWTPLLMVSPTSIVNLGDGSLFAQVQVQYDWQQDLVVFAGLQAGFGSRGTEYGGLATDTFDGYLAPGARVWARLARYF